MRLSKEVMTWVGVVGLALLAQKAGAGKIYYMGTGQSGIDTAVSNALTARGHTVTAGASYNNDQYGVDVSTYDVILLHEYQWAPNVWAGPLCSNAATSGRGVVTMGWTYYNYANLEGSAPWGSILPGTYSGYAYPDPFSYAIVTTNATLSAGLGNPVVFPADNWGGTEDGFTPKTGATRFYKSGASGNGVVGWESPTRCKGRAISISAMGGTAATANTNFNQLLANAITWAANSNQWQRAPRALKVYVTKDAGDGTHAANIRNMLGAAGYVTNNPASAKAPSGLTTADLDGFDVVLLDGAVEIAGSITLGATAQGAVTNLLARGGGVITCGWMNYYNANNSVQNLAFMPGTEAGYGGDTWQDYTIVTTNTTLCNLIVFDAAGKFRVTPATSGYNRDSSDPKPGATKFFTWNYGGGIGNVSGWEYGGGHVLTFDSFLSSAELVSLNFRQLLINAVMWAAPPPPPPPPPLPPRGTIISIK